MINCTIAQRCSGCPWMGDDLASQRRHKTEVFTGVFDGDAVAWVDVGEGAIRDRVDLTLREGSLGLYDREGKGVVDMTACPMMTPALEAWLRDFRGMLPPLVKRGSLRLRVSPSGERGLWLDFSHEDMKALLDEAEWLQGLLAAGVLVDVGQRRKPLSLVEGRLKLSKEPRLHPWFETVVPRASGSWVATPLFVTVASFSQPGFAANGALVRTVLGALAQQPRGKVLELFSGSGNLSIALAGAGFTVSAWELDPMARRGAEMAWVEAQRRGLVGEGALSHHTGDLYSKLTELLPTAPLWVVDPPRGGLGAKLLALLASSEGPETMLYVSCHSEALAADLQVLQREGFDVVSVQAVDQFPHSPHAEWVVLCQRHAAAAINVI